MANQHVVWVVLLMVIAQAVATPPGIANHPSHATCKIKKYKHCYNLEHVCPKFCPDSCTVECASCKPICTDGSTTPPPESSPPPTTIPTLPPATPPTTPTLPPATTPPSSPPPTTPNLPPATTPPPSSPPPTTPNLPPAATPPSFHPPPTTPNLPPATTPPSSPPPTTPTLPPANTPPVSPPPTPSTHSPTPSTPSPTTPPSPPTTSPPLSSTPSTPSPAQPTPPYPPSTSPPNSGTAPARRTRCRNRNYPQCYNIEYACPSSCPGGCEVDCVTCRPICSCDRPGAVCQDPRFIGGDGLTFYFHGKKDHEFCLVSDPNLHINAHFIGKHNPNMKRDFTWVQSIGILFGDQRLFIGAQKTATWNDAIDRLTVIFNGEPVSLLETNGARWQSETQPAVSIIRVSDANQVIVEVEGIFRITAKAVPITDEESSVHNYGITADDCFAHLDLGFKFFSLTVEVNGVLGQTYRNDYVSRATMGAPMPVMGGEKEFAVSSIFSADCAVAKFTGKAPAVGSELPSLKCGSGMGGAAVCEK